MRVFFYIIALVVVLPSAVNATDCSKLSPLVCLQSVKCTLDYVKPKNGETRIPPASFFCRNEITECEMGTRQDSLNREDCEANKKCNFIPDNCFCPCDFAPKTCSCECGGGSPANCVLR